MTTQQSHDRPGGPSATTFPRAGSTNHQGANEPNEEQHMTGQTTHIMTVMDPADPESTEQARPLCRDIGVLLLAAFVLAFDLAALIAAVHYMRNGVIPTWLDAHGGQWAWMGSGAFAGWFVLDALPLDADRFHHAAWWLAHRPAPVHIARDGGEQL